MAGIMLLCFCGVLLGAVPVLGGTEYRLGGPDGNPWQVVGGKRLPSLCGRWPS